MDNIVNTLFPTPDIRSEDSAVEDMSELTPFTTDELVLAAHKLKNNKTPRPGGTPAEVLKEIADTNAEILLNMYNSCLAVGIFPERDGKSRNSYLSAKEKDIR